MRSAWPKTCGATTWPSSCCRPTNSSADPDRGQRVVEQRDDDRRQRAEERPDERDELHEPEEGAEGERVGLALREDAEHAEDPQRQARARAHDQAEEQLAADVAGDRALHARREVVLARAVARRHDRARRARRSARRRRACRWTARSRARARSRRVMRRSQQVGAERHDLARAARGPGPAASPARSRPGAGSRCRCPRSSNSSWTSASDSFALVDDRRARRRGTTATWSAIGLARMAPAAASVSEEAERSTTTIGEPARHAARAARAPTMGFRISAMTAAMMNSEQHDARRLGDRVEREHGERQRDELDPARDHDRCAARRARPAGCGGALLGVRRFAHRPPCARVCAVPDAPATILFVGDVVGGLGRRTLLGLLPALRERHEPTFVVVNGENVAGGLGITPKIADELFAAGVDAITLGNHAYHRREIFPYLDEREQHRAPGQLPAPPARPRLLRGRARRRAPRRRQPHRATSSCAPAAPAVRRDRDACSGASTASVDHVLVDMHAEATSEKVAHGLVPRRPRDRGRRHAHARPDRRRARAARAGPPTSPTSG